MAWTSPRTWVAGETVTAALLNTHLRDDLKAIGDPWTSYTPTWTAATTNPAIGNGTIVGAWAQAGKMTWFRATITMGSTTTYGSGQWRLTLPATPVTQLWNFQVELRDTGVASFQGRAVYSSSGYLEIFSPPTTAGTADRAVASNVPITWGNTDVLFVSGVYEAA